MPGEGSPGREAREAYNRPFPDNPVPSAPESILESGAPLIGRTLAHYRVTNAIGAGGMGEVFRATDTRLGREVALKVLPPEMASRPDRLARFQREARAVAALNHPHIVTIHSVEEADGVHFLTMELLEGQPLDRLIPAAGLPPERILEVAAALTGALAAAHDRGIVHRDLKPANVMVTRDGGVKVLDFGLAKIAGAADGPSSGSELSTAMKTREGVVMGTLPYMSPEQVQGRAVDHRSDIFSLGVILYEMATGRRPFQADSAAGLMSAILRDTPASPVSLRGGLPESLQGAIERCLAKDPDARFQQAREVAEALRGRLPTDNVATVTGDSPVTAGPVRRPDSSPSRAEVPWIAVLPLKTQGADQDLATFADGLGEDITTGLSRFSHLFVISRQSAQQYAGRSLDVRAVGRELGARYALEGAVRKAGSAVRVSVQLLDASTGTHLWAETYDRDLAGAEIFAIQDDLTHRIVATVADPCGVLVRSMALAVRDRPFEELTVTELVLRFFAYGHQVRADEHAGLRAALERRLEREPGHADAWACLARLYSHEHQHRVNPRPDSIERARRAARRAVEIDSTCQMGWEALGEASYFARDLGTFGAAAERAMSLNPLNTNTAASMAMLIARSGEWDRGVEITRAAMALNPHHPGWYHFTLFYDHYRKGEFDQALQTAKRINMPELFWTHAVTAAACGRLGRRQEARAALAALRGLFPDYREALRPNLALWMLDAGVVEEVMQGLADAEALAASSGAATRTSHAGNPDGPESAARPTRSVAVLPFKDLAGTPDDAHIGIGLADATITELARLRALLVRPTSAILRFQDRPVDPRQAARELAVDAVVDGSFQRAGERLRVTVQLVDPDGRSLWASRVDASLTDVFGMQDDVSRQIAEALHVELGSGKVSPRPPEARPAPVGSAYELYLRGRLSLFRGRLAGVNAAIDAFEQARDADPGFARAWAGLADAYARMAFEHAPDGGWDERARAMCARALELDPVLAEGRYVRGRLAWSPNAGFDHATALREAGAALAADPALVAARYLLGLVLFHVGLVAEAEAEFRRALADDPDDPYAHMHFTTCRLHQGRFGEAVVLAEADLSAFPDRWSWTNLTHGLLRLGRLEEASRAIDRLSREDPDYPQGRSLGALLAALQGDPARARRGIERTQQARRDFGHYHHAQYDVACALAALGDPGGGMEWLRAAVASGYPCPTFFSVDALLDPLRSHADYPPLLRDLESGRDAYRQIYLGLPEHRNLNTHA